MEVTVNRLTWAIALSLVCLGVVLRVLPHPANFAPITAIALFGGAVFKRHYAVVIPVLAMIVSDAIIGFYSLIFVTWACYALIALASHLWLQKLAWRRVGVLTLASSLFFFVVTNFAVWVGGGLYPHTLAGLERCFVLALPFFRNTALSDLIYTSALFGLYALAIQGSRKLIQASARSRAS